MKSLLLAATALTAFTVSSFAADLPARKQAPVFTAAPAFTWTGFYIGGDIGGAWGRERDTLHIILGDSFPVAGAMGGAHIGYNWQMNQIVFGAEADVDASNVTGKTPAVGFPPGSFLSLKNDWRASLRLRAGYAIDTTLLYVTGGAAFAGVKSNLVVNVDPSWSHTLGGWTIGAGVELRIRRIGERVGPLACRDDGARLARGRERAGQKIGLVVARGRQEGPPIEPRAVDDLGPDPCKLCAREHGPVRGPIVVRESRSPRLRARLI